MENGQFLDPKSIISAEIMEWRYMSKLNVDSNYRDNINPAFSVPASTTRTFCNNAQDSIVLIDMAGCQCLKAVKI